MPMMGGPGMFAMMSWMLLGTLLFIVLVVIIVWFLIHWLNTREQTSVRYRPQNQDTYRGYEQGYQPPEPGANAAQEGMEPSQNTQDEQPQAQYPQEQREQSMPEQR